MRLAVDDLSATLGDHCGQPVRDGLVRRLGGGGQQPLYQLAGSGEQLWIVVVVEQLVRYHLEDLGVVEQVKHLAGGGPVLHPAVDQAQRAVRGPTTATGSELVEHPVGSPGSGSVVPHRLLVRHPEPTDLQAGGVEQFGQRRGRFGEGSVVVE